MKAKELATLLMKHPEADVHIEYIPYGEPITYTVGYNGLENYVFIEESVDAPRDNE